MPTGSGKSMCYQLPAIVDGGLTVVVSPLIALMRDQVQQMRGFGVAAATLNSATGDDETRETWRLLREKELRLLFVSPERLQAEGLAARLRDAGVRRLAIDEAHCVSQWGHDFRPEYRSIGRARRALGDVQTVAFTATADKATRDDIAERLFEGRPRILVHSLRPAEHRAALRAEGPAAPPDRRVPRRPQGRKRHRLLRLAPAHRERWPRTSAGAAFARSPTTPAWTRARAAATRTPSCRRTAS